MSSIDRVLTGKMQTQSSPRGTNREPPSPQPDDAEAFETVPCPLCRSTRFVQVRTARDLMFGTGEAFTLVRCTGCGHVFLNPRPTPAQILRYYPDDYGPHHNVPAGVMEERDAGDRRPWYLSPLARSIPGLRRAYYWLIDSPDVLFPAFPRMEDSVPRILELGCSDGEFLLQLQQRGWETVGVEPAAAPAARARGRGLDVRCGTLEPGMFPPRSFDAACGWHVVEHLHEPRDVLNELFRILKPGGELLLSLPNYGCWEPHAFGEYWFAIQPPIHLHHFTPRSLRSLLELCGFESVTCLHQRNLSYVVGSAGLWLRDRNRLPRLADRLLAYPDSPTLAGQLLLALPARILAACRQGGRITVRARRRHE